MFRDALSALVRGRSLTRSESSATMEAIMDGALSPAEMGAFLAALTLKGETVEELVGLAQTMRKRCVPVAVPGCELLDTCGTGGSGQATINTSTMVAFVVAAAGVHVAKHGNRASSGRCGSMDVLEHLGVPISLDGPQVAHTLATLGIGFMLAPLFHPALKHIAPVRRALGIATTFNFLGPLANPAGVRRQILGVSDPRRAPIMLEALRELGSQRVMVVHGEDGLDEITLTGRTRTWTLWDGEVREGSLTPEEFGLATVPSEAIAGGDVARNAQMFRAVLSSRAAQPLLDLVALNAAAALFIAEAVPSIRDGVAEAKRVLACGAGDELFVEYREKARLLVAPEKTETPR